MAEWRAEGKEKRASRKSTMEKDDRVPKRGEGNDLKKQILGLGNEFGKYKSGDTRRQKELYSILILIFFRRF